MVWHLLERLLGTNGKLPKETILEDGNIKYLTSQGFSLDEAKHFSWIFNYYNYGRYTGILTGCVFLYMMNPWVKRMIEYYPKLSLSYTRVNFFRGAILFGFYKVGEYCSSWRRYGSNSNFGYLNSNNMFTRNRDSLLINFNVMNRKFTEFEKEQFLTNKYLRKYGPREYVYNPSIHPGSKQTWEKIFEKLNAGVAPYRLQEVKKQIQHDNRIKEEFGEEIQYEPFNISKHVDSSGNLFGLKKPHFLDHYNVIPN